jgi:hypothetical protein
MADGEWLSAPMGDFMSDPRLEVIYENGRPSYFQEKTCKPDEPIDNNKTPSEQQTSKQLNGNSTVLGSNTEAAVENVMEIVEMKLQDQASTPPSLCLDEIEEEKVTKLATSLSYYGVRNEKGELINPFFGSEHPLLDPSSSKFSTKAWLETVMSITSRDPERYPKRVAGIAYKSLSVHGFGEPTDYQKTFGNYPFKLFNWAKRLLGKESKTRIQILRDFDGLVKSGSMLLVLGRPGRQVIL